MGAVLPDEIQVDRRQAVQRSALIAGQRHRLQEHFRQDHGGPAVEVDAPFEPRDVRDEVPKVAQAPLAERRAGGIRVHVDDVGADPDMDGDRYLETARRAEDADGRVRRLQLVQVAHHRLPEPEPVPDALVDRGVQQAARLLGHPEAPRPQRLVDVFRGRAAQGELEVVDHPGAVGREPRDESALHQIDEDRREACLQDVRAEAPHDAVAAVARLAHSRHHRLEIRRRQEARHRVEQSAHAASGLERGREIPRVRLAVPARKRIGAHAGKVELLVRQFHGVDYSRPRATRRTLLYLVIPAGVAQLVRARGSYPRCPGFKSLHRHHSFIW